MKAAGLLEYVWPFCGHQSLKVSQSLWKVKCKKIQYAVALMPY